MGKAVIIIILGSVLTMSMMRISLFNNINAGMDNAFAYYENMQARNIGNSMVNMLLSKIADSSTYRMNDYEFKSFYRGSMKYRVVDSALVEGDTLIKINVEVNFNGYPKTITSYTRPAEGGWVPPFVRGAWTANGSLSKTISDMYIDGRDYDLNLNIIPNSGTYGVSSSVEFINEENAAIGGTYEFVDYEMTYPENDDIIEEFHDWGGTFPQTPDEILGYPEGTLKTIAQSGIQGSQYVLNPNKIENELTFPLSGVTYVELTDGKERDFKIIGNGNGGILVVHGPNASSRLKSVKMQELKTGKDEVVVCHLPGTEDESTLVIDESLLAAHLSHGDFEGECSSNSWFQGLIITDYSFHHHLNILGAILQLSPNLEAEKICNGNDDHWVKYSSDAIESSTRFVTKDTGLIGNNNNYYSSTGFGCGRQKTVYWYE